MKTKMILSAFALLLFLNAVAQTPDEKGIEETILTFAKAADLNQTDKLASCLDENYRIVMNRLFGSDQVSVMSKIDFLDKIRTKEFGGDNRKVEIESITINGNTANAKVSFVGKMTFISLLTLIKDEESKWKLIADVPVVL